MSTTGIPRGIMRGNQIVRSQSGETEAQKVIAAISTFKKTYNEALARVDERVAGLESWTDDQAKAIAATRAGGAGPATFTDRDESDWVTPDGKPVSVLTSTDLRDRARIAAKLGVSAPKAADAFGFGDFLRGVAGLKTKPGVYASLSEGVGPSGGFTVPGVLMPGFLAALAPASATLQAGARIVPAESGPGLLRSMCRVDTLPTAAWRAENGAVAESDPVLGLLTFNPRSLAFFFKVSLELLQDSANIEQIATYAIAEAFAQGMDTAALMGNGATEPLGILSAPDVNSVSMGTHGAAPTNWDPFVDALYETELDNAPASTAAISHPRTWRTMRKLKDTTNQPLQAPEEVAALRKYGTTKLPITQTQGSSTDCTSVIVGDFTRMFYLMRKDVSIVRAEQAHIGNGQVGFYCFARLDVGFEYTKAFTKIIGVRP